MSYSVIVVRREVQAAYQAVGSMDFFENTDNIAPLGEALTTHLLEQLTLRGFVASKKKSGPGRSFSHPDWSASALLTPRGLYLSGSGDGIFEISMMGSELADRRLAKFDPQEGSWE